MTELADWVRRNSKFLQLADGESVEGTYEGYKISANNFDPEKERVVYKLSIDGQSKYFQSAAASVARFFDLLPVGSSVKITRAGLKMDTKYTCVSPDAPHVEQEEEESVPF